MVDLLLNIAADVDMARQDGMTSLHVASQNSYLAAAGLLLEAVAGIG